MRQLRVPTNSFSLMVTVYKQIFPSVKRELSYWQKRAEEIPNNELRTQALASINSKRFHCQGGAVFSLLAGEKHQAAVRFIVAYQTISDYLDNLCDRSTSMDPDDFRLLHQSMIDALSPNQSVKNYYACRNDQDDGGYLEDLVKTCQLVLEQTQLYPVIRATLLKLEGLYGDLQVHKHVRLEERIPRLTEWFEKNKDNATSLSWYEFSAAAGSTLGIFCTVSYALSGNITEEVVEQIYQGYFPYVQGLHILLDYYIDQLEDKEEGDLNFCFYYPSQEILKERLYYFIEQADKHIQRLPDPFFHRMIHHGLVGLYLGDSKVAAIENGAEMRRKLLKASGKKATFFYWNTRMYYKLTNKA
ncbi:tetraprenyl-beta-curcumene synthase family protein [Oceanobacillus limi]|uniref:tetraprenyl-beta-curcumene synthase family protein n=1 Tax=Oceanobacillus limi TaxID=930131 RepID=UPI00244EF798|nr:tetraprenyl-beta-curcumene synthase family protein [Oceanobacillus limi]